MSRVSIITRSTLAAVAVLAVSACGGTPAQTTTPAPETTAAETTAAPAETTAAPAETTAAPAETTAAPAETSAPPAQPETDLTGLLLTGEVAGITFKAIGGTEMPGMPAGATVEPAECIAAAPEGMVMAGGASQTGLIGSVGLVSGAEHAKTMADYVSKCATTTSEFEGMKAEATNEKLDAPAIAGAEDVVAIKTTTKTSGETAGQKIDMTMVATQIVGVVNGTTIVAGTTNMAGDADLATAQQIFEAQAAKLAA